MQVVIRATVIGNGKLRNGICDMPMLIIKKLAGLMNNKLHVNI